MQEATTYLITNLFFAVLVFYFYRHNRKQRHEKPKLTHVSLLVDRAKLLQQQRQFVAQRRGNLPPKVEVKKPIRPDVQPATTLPVADDATEDGFGEDLGAALSLKQEPAKTKRQSRFGAMMQAANELADAYKEHNSIHS